MSTYLFPTRNAAPVGPGSRPPLAAPRRWGLLASLLGLLLCGLPAALQAQPIQAQRIPVRPHYTPGLDFNTDKIMHYVRHPTPSLMQLCAHRGLFDAGNAPENSLAAVRAAYRARIELVEVDIKTTRDGVPILMHDDTPFRTVRFVDMYRNNIIKQFRQSALVSKLDLSYFYSPNRRSYLRENFPRNSPQIPANTPVTFEPVYSLDGLLTILGKETFFSVIVLDIKNLHDLALCVEVVAQHKNLVGKPFLDSFIFKFDGKDMPTYADYLKVVKETGGHNFHYMLRFNSTTAYQFPFEKPQDLVDAYQDHARYSRGGKYFMGVEVGTKAEFDNDPLSDLSSYAVSQINTSDPHACWCYYPLPELADRPSTDVRWRKRYIWGGSESSSPNGDGTYCLQWVVDNDNKVLAASGSGNHEYRDMREDLYKKFDAVPFMEREANVTGLTYDDPVALDGYLRKQGKPNTQGQRNTQFYYDFLPHRTAPVALAEGVYTVANGASAQQLALPEAIGLGGMRTLAASAPGTAAQYWRVTSTGGGYFTLTNQQSGQRLASAGGALVPAPASPQDSTQLWTTAPGPAGSVVLLNARAPQHPATDVAGTAMLADTILAGDPIQQWKFTLVEVLATPATAARGTASPTASRVAGPGPVLELYPNPADGFLTIRCQNESAGQARLTLRSLTGQVVAEKTVLLTAGSSEVLLPTAQLAPGCYVLNWTTGTTQVVRRIMLAH